MLTRSRKKQNGKLFELKKQSILFLRSENTREKESKKKRRREPSTTEESTESDSN